MSSRHVGTPESWEADLAERGIVWNLGQLSPATVRRLDKVGDRHKACWPYFWAGVQANKTCWLRKDHPLALHLRKGE